MAKKRLTNNRYNTTHLLQVDEVVDLDTLISFLSSRTGTPRPLAKNKGAVSKKAKEFFAEYPDAEWRALTDLANWASAKNKHYDMIRLVGSWRYAYEDGFMRILGNGSSTNDDRTLNEMLKHVEDKEVRERMIGAATASDRDVIYKTYRDTSEVRDISHEPGDPLADLGLAAGQAVKVRFSAADNAIAGTIVGLAGSRLEVYAQGETLPVPFDLVQVRRNGEWECIL